MQIIYKAGDITEAHIVAGLLNANHIETHVGGFYLQGGVGDLAAMDFVNVQVEDEDVLRAEKIIQEYEGEAENIAPVENREIITSDFLSRVFIAVLAFSFVIIIIFLVLEVQ
jgi:hypothetical protein